MAAPVNARDAEDAPEDAVASALGDDAPIARALLASAPAADPDARGRWLLRAVLQAMARDPRSFARPFEGAAALNALADDRSWFDERELALGVALRLAPSPEALLDFVDRRAEAFDSQDRLVEATAAAEHRASVGPRGQPRPMDGALRIRFLQVHAQLGDREAVARLGADGVRPDQLAPRRRSLPGFAPDANGLLDALRARVTEGNLQRIAVADRGADGPEHHEALRHIVATGRVPPLLSWVPGEVLRLRRWSSGRDVNHVERAFCVTLLELCSDEDGPFDDAPILIESALALGPPAPALAEGLMAWRYVTGSDRRRQDRIGLLWGLAVLAAAADPADPRLGTVADELQRFADDEWSNGEYHLDHQLRYSRRRELWRDLIARWLEPHREEAAIGRILALEQAWA